MASNEAKSSTKQFQCASCPKSYTRKSDLKVHQLTKHLDNELKCYSCEKCLDKNQLPNKFASHGFLNKHIQQVHGQPRFKCQICFKTFPDSSNFRKHQRTHIHNIKKTYTCEFCSKSFRSKPHFQTHVFNVHKQKPEGLNYLKCDLCSLEFVNRSSLERHVVSKHVVDKNVECHICSNTFIDQETLEKHIKRHDPQLKHFCDVCSKGFKQKSSLIHHLEVEHKNLFYCSKCCRSFCNKSDFDQHSDPKTNSEQKLEFNCQICDESFDFQCNLDIHINSHLNQINVSKADNDDIGDVTDAKMSTSPKPKLTEELNLKFQCELCVKSYDREAYLKTHRAKVHASDDWICDFEGCSQTFKLYNQFRIHKLTHSETKPFVCTICQKSFYQAKYLKKHETTHLKNKKHACEMCPKSFTTPGTLRIHVANNHGGLKPFKCPIKNCETSWATNTLLKLHSNSHLTFMLLKCEICTKSSAFSSLASLEQQKRHVHSDT